MRLGRLQPHCFEQIAVGADRTSAAIIVREKYRAAFLLKGLLSSPFPDIPICQSRIQRLTRSQIVRAADAEEQSCASTGANGRAATKGLPGFISNADQSVNGSVIYP